MGSIQPLSSRQMAYTTKTDYCGNVIYEDGILSKILTDEGHITLSGSTPTYHYYMKDHLGNNRVVMAQSGTVEQIKTDMILSGRQKCKRPTQAVLSRSEIN